MRIKLLILILFSLTFGTTPAFAVSVIVSNPPSEITDQPFSLNVSITGASPATNYLRVSLFPPGTTKYFGYTNNGTTFINSSDYSQYLPITIDSSGSWSGVIEARLDIASSYYEGPGTYSLKVRRYTQSGSSYTWSKEISLSVNLPTPAPTPSPSPTPTPTPTPSHTPTPSPTPKKTSSPTNTPAPKPTLKPSPAPQTSLAPQTPLPSILKPSSKEYRIASVAAVATKAASISANTKVINDQQFNPFKIIGAILIIVGLAIPIFFFIKLKLKSKPRENLYN